MADGQSARLPASGANEGLGEQVDAAFEALVGEPLRDRGDQSAAARAGIDFL